MAFASLLLAVAFVAFTNGANANFKGVASLYGSGTTSLKVALWWGTATTFAGSIAAMFMAEGLIRKFSGKGLVDDALTSEPVFAGAVAGGAAVTSFLATRCGFPVSTTHALVGALVGAGLAGGDHSVHWSALGQNFLYPLLVSPVLAMSLGALVYGLFRWSRFPTDGRSRLLDTAHFVSAGAASFARGLNDTPKMAALLMLVPGTQAAWAMLGVGVMIAIGAILDARNVAETLGKKVTNMTPFQGFSANLVTSVLVTTASFHSFPVSTTHVSVGSLTGMGISTGQAKYKKIAEIMVAWITTVPCGALAAAVIFGVCRLLS